MRTRTMLSISLTDFSVNTMHIIGFCNFIGVVIHFSDILPVVAVVYGLD